MGKILGEERTARSERTSKLPSRSLRRYDPYQVRRVVWNHAVQNSQPIKDTPAYASIIAFPKISVNTHGVCLQNLSLNLTHCLFVLRRFLLQGPLTFCPHYSSLDLVLPIGQISVKLVAYRNGMFPSLTAGARRRENENHERMP